MAIYLQSISDNTKYFTGSTIDSKGYVLGIFGDIVIARNFDNVNEAQEVSETIKVPVKIVED